MLLYCQFSFAEPTKIPPTTALAERATCYRCSRAFLPSLMISSHVVRNFAHGLFDHVVDAHPNCVLFFLPTKMCIRRRTVLTVCSFTPSIMISLARPRSGPKEAAERKPPLFVVTCLLPRAAIHPHHFVSADFWPSCDLPIKVIPFVTEIGRARMRSQCSHY